jgi:hypothetical protein
MSKEFQYIKGSKLSDVLAIALGEDEGSSSVCHRFVEDRTRLWLVRRLHNDRSFRYLECFEFDQNSDKWWGLRGWSEEEKIPYVDCPLDLLSQTNGSIRTKWRLAVLAYHGNNLSLPPNVWIHSISGVRLPEGRIGHDFRHISNGQFQIPGSTEVFRLKPSAVGRIMQEGFGIAAGRA